MKLSAALLALTALNHRVQASCKDRNKAFAFAFDGECNYESILSAFETHVFGSQVYGCETSESSAEEELNFLLDGVDVLDVCEAGFNAYNDYKFDDIPMEDGGFVRRYYNGGTYWNEEQETKYGDQGEGNPSNVLRSRNQIIGDAERVQEVYDGVGRSKKVEFPDYLSNFENCQYNAAYCCWPGDRQANDNNGNCRDPYDSRCIDRVPSDNTNVCYIDLERGANSTGFESEEGYEIFPFDDANDNNNPTDRGEGQVHCHGFAWAEQGYDKSAVYKGNNLFYVSMYDHMTQRGYVRNLPGAPMCACAEQMPIVERSDCTQIAVDEEFKFTYDFGNSSISLEKLYIDFQSCQGYDREGRNDDNDLWSYSNRLFQEGKLSAEKLAYLSTVLVGENPDRCDDATDRFMQEKGYITGYNEDTTQWHKIAARDALGETYFGDSAFCEAFVQSPNRIIKRVSVNSYHNHQYIYYKRRASNETYEQCMEYKINYSLLSGRSNSAGNTWNQDFLLFSSYEDALDPDNTNAWDCASIGGYRYDQGFPGDCGPTPLVHNDKRDYQSQETRFEPRSGKRDVAFYLEVDPENAGSRLPGASSFPTDVDQFDKTSDIGNCNLPGTSLQTYNASTGFKIHMTASCHDVWNNNDNMNYVYDESVSEEVEMIAKVSDFKPVNTYWTKTGLMIRASADPKSQHCSVLYSPRYGIVIHNRYNYNGGTSWYENYDGHRTDGYYKWMKLTRHGGSCIAYKSTDGQDWVRIHNAHYVDFGGTENQNNRRSLLEGNSTVTAGLFLTSNSGDTRYAQASFEHFEMQTYVCNQEQRRLSNVSRL